MSLPHIHTTLPQVWGLGAQPKKEKHKKDDPSPWLERKTHMIFFDQKTLVTYTCTYDCIILLGIDPQTAPSINIPLKTFYKFLIPLW